MIRVLTRIAECNNNSNCQQLDSARVHAVVLWPSNTASIWREQDSSNLRETKCVRTVIIPAQTSSHEIVQVVKRFAAPEEALLDEALFLPPPLNNYIY